MKLIKIGVLLIALALTKSYDASAQQDPSFTMYNQHMNIVNPAYAGSTETTDLNFSIRGQWLDSNGIVETQSFSLSSGIGKNVGVGLSIVNDKVFVTRETDVYADFSYKLQVNEKNHLFLGLKAGGTFFNADLTSLDVTDDPLFANNVNTFNPNFGAGAYLKGNNYYATLSIPVILKSNRYEKEASIPMEASDKAHIYFGGGYTFVLTNDNYNWKITPSTLVRYVANIPVSIDITAMAEVLQKVQFGTSYRIEESLSGILTFAPISNLKVGYAYEHPMSDIVTYSGGTHEVLLKIRF